MDFICEIKDKQLRKGKLKRNDVVLTTRGTLGNVAVYDESVKYDNIRINSGMVILRPDTSKINSKYLFKLFQSDNIQKQILSISSGSAQPQLPIRSLINLELIIPPIEEQQEIVSRIEKEQNIINSNKELIKIYEQKIKDEINKLWKN